MKKRGITLIAVILLMTLLAITVVGLTTFVIERLCLAAVRENEINAYYMAQAGIHYGIWRYIEKGKKKGGSGNMYADREFKWQIPPFAGDIFIIKSAGFSPGSSPKKAGCGGCGQIKKKLQIKKELEAKYNITTKKLVSLKYQ